MQAILALEDGRIFRGIGFGAPVEAAGNGFDFGKFRHAVRITRSARRRALLAFRFSLLAQSQELRAISRFAPLLPGSVC